MDWSHHKSGFETEARMVSIIPKRYKDFLHHTSSKQRGSNKENLEKQLALPSLSPKTCGMLARKSEERWTSCTRFDSSRGW